MKAFARLNASLLVLCMSSLQVAGMLGSVAVAVQVAVAQDSSASGFGPLDPTAPKDITPQEIIARFGEREAEFAQARDNYTFRQSVKVDASTRTPAR